MINLSKTFFIYLFLSLIIFNLSFLALASNVNCKDIESNPNAKPEDLASCGAPDELKNKIEAGASLYDNIMLINNVLLILATFFSIIGAIVGTINLAKAQANKTSFEEARNMITNSILAFFITVAIWIIVKLVFNTLGIGEIAPVKPL